jgi:hypothetical protein
MPPLVLEVGVVLTLGATLIRITNAINRIETQQKLAYAELIGKHDVLTLKLGGIENQNLELKQEVKEIRRRRYSDPDTGFN